MSLSSELNRRFALHLLNSNCHSKVASPRSNVCKRGGRSQNLYLNVLFSVWTSSTAYAHRRKPTLADTFSVTVITY